MRLRVGLLPQIMTVIYITASPACSLRSSDAGADIRSSLQAALSSYQDQQAKDTTSGTAIAQSKLLEDSIFHGTTTCAFVFDNGILVAVDSRASMGKIW